MRTTHRKRIDEENATAEGVKQNGTGQPDAKAKDEKPKPPFWEFVNGLGDRWSTEGVVVYVYRIWPVIDKREEEHYLCKVSEPFDEDFLLKNFGSGKYLLQANNRRGKTLHKRVVSIHNIGFPPKVDPGEVVSSDPRNETFFSVWAKKSDGTTATRQQPSAQTDVNTVLTTVLEKTGSFDPKLAELWEKTARERDDLSKALAARNAPPDLLSVVKQIKELFPSPTAPTPPTQQTDMASLLRLAKELQPPVPPAPNPLELLEQVKGLVSPPQDDLAHIDRLLSIADRLASVRGGGGGGGRRSGWDVGLDYVRELTPLAPYLGSMFGLRIPGMAAPGSTPGTAAPAAPVGQFDPYANPDRLRQHAQTVNGAGQAAAQPGAAAGAGQTPAGDGPQPPNEIQTLLANSGGLVLSALNGGLSGAEFADNVANLFGSATPAFIANHGEDALTASMLSIPEFKMFGEAKLRKFVHEFCNYESILDSEEPEAGPGAAA
jgi:hypothetical protein